MKDKSFALLDNYKDHSIQFGDILFQNPELGFKEVKTKQLLMDELKSFGYEVDQEYAHTGFSVSIGSGHPHIGLIAEMDAIPTLGHPYADVNDQSAAHACGHSTQCAIMVSVMRVLKDLDLPEGKVTLFFTPAEEFTDLAYRRELIKEGKIKYPAGKIEMLTQGIFDDVDLCIHLHAMGPSEYHFCVDTTLAGFIYKKFTFKGKASHAAVLPHLGVNALNAFALFQSAAGMLRETYIDEDKNRFHGIVTEGGQTVNSIPERVVYESYVRSFNTNNLRDLSDKLTNAAKHCAMALGGDCEVEDTPGYLPFVQDRNINKVVEKNMTLLVEADEIMHDEKSVAAGDIGDMGCFIPAVQFGYGGFGGAIHGKDMCILDKERVYVEPAKIVVGTVLDLLNDPAYVEMIKKHFKPSMTMEEYLKYLEG